MNDLQIAIVGTGGFAREVLCLATDLGRYDDVACFLERDDVWERCWGGKTLMGKPVVRESLFDPSRWQLAIGVGSPQIRRAIVGKMPPETRYATLVHPSAVVSQWVGLGEGAIICAGCVLTCDIHIGEHAQLNLNTTVGHDCQIGDFFTTAPGVNVSGRCQIGDEVYIGSGAALREELRVCSQVLIGMGAVVVKDLVQPGTYVGNPARLLER